jgi:hypothetical protein
VLYFCDELQGLIEIKPPSGSLVKLVGIKGPLVSKKVLSVFFTLIPEAQFLITCTIFIFTKSPISTFGTKIVKRCDGTPNRSRAAGHDCAVAL